MLRRLPPKFARIQGEFRDREFSVLDVGCGNHSATATKRVFPRCKYYGIDRESYNNSKSDFAEMEVFYELDLESDPLSSVPEDFFDVILLSHVIEHLTDGVALIGRLVTKLRTGGVIYIEFPSVRSLSFPSMRGTLHFCDDPSHVRLYDVKEICNHLLMADMTVVKAGNLRDPVKILQFPLLVAYHLLRGTLSAGVFWYVLGFSDFVFARKNREPLRGPAGQ